MVRCTSGSPGPLKGGDEMEARRRPNGRLGLMGHELFVERFGEHGDAFHLGDARAFDDVGLDDIDLRLEDQVTELPAGYLCSPAETGTSRASATCASPMYIVLRDGLLK